MKIFESDEYYQLSDEATELYDYLNNDSALYDQKIRSIIPSLQRKIKSGKYDPVLAPKLWMYFVDAAAQRYVQEHGAPGDTVTIIFPKPDRLQLANYLAKQEYESIMMGEYDWLNKRNQARG